MYGKYYGFKTSVGDPLSYFKIEERILSPLPYGGRDVKFPMINSVMNKGKKQPK